MAIIQNYFIPQEGSKSTLDQYCNDLLVSHQVATGCADILILQPPFDNDLLITLPEDQALAANHAATFKSGKGFGFATSYLTGLSSISELIISLLTNLDSIAFNLDTGSPDSSRHNQSLNDFHTIVDNIIASCTDIDPNSATILSHLNEINTVFSQLNAEIQDDDTRLSTAIKEVKNNNIISKLEAQQRFLQSQLSDVNREIAKGATTTIASDVEFGFSFAKEFLDGVTTGAIAGAVLDIVGEAGAIDQFNEQVKDLRDKQKSIGSQISALVDNIAQDKYEVMTLTLTAAQVGEFNIQVKDLLSTTSSVIDQMTDWKKQLELLSDYKTAPEPHFYGTQVRDGLNYWTNLNLNLNRYLANMTYSKKIVENTF